MSLLSKVNWSDVVVRSVKTFVATFVTLQGFAPILSWAGGHSPVDFSSSRAALLGAAIAVTTYVWNVVLQILNPTPTPGSRADLASSGIPAGVHVSPSLARSRARRPVTVAADPEPPAAV